MSQVLIRVEPVKDGRLTGWAVRCAECQGDILLPLRTKTTAVVVATEHSKAVHQGRGLVAVKKR